MRKPIGVFIMLAIPLAASAHDREYRVVEQSHQECWQEQVRVRESGQGLGGAIIGGIAGGLLGNQVGGGNGKTVATAVGAATGAVVGDRMSADAPSGTGFRAVTRCRTVVEPVRVPVEHEGRHFCPPGQAKKGNC